MRSSYVNMVIFNWTTNLITSDIYILCVEEEVVYKKKILFCLEKWPHLTQSTHSLHSLLY